MKTLFAACMVLTTSFAALALPQGAAWTTNDWIIKDDVNDVGDGALDLCNVFLRETEGQIHLKITTRNAIRDNCGVEIDLRASEDKAFALRRTAPDARSQWTIYRGVCEVSVNTPEAWRPTSHVSVRLLDARGVIVDAAAIDLATRRSLDNETGNCAFVHHGNQGLTYTDVFRGTGGSSSNGFDEILELHQALQTPGNFHLSGTLITSAEWYDPAFNQWLRDGIAEGWVAMLTSAYGQHIMPFVADNMNNWAVNIQKNLVQTIFNYHARVAWIPERVWLAQGHYPDAGLSDPWLGDNWTPFGVDAVILDDWPHAAGYSDRQIHWMNNGSGITLRVIPIDGEFTGNCHYNPGAAIAQIAGTGRYGLVVYGTDWEAAAEMADFSCPNCLENYTQVVTWAHDNFPAVGTWKLDSALGNPDFNGTGIEVGTGTYGLIGGEHGYGGSNNSWYTHWAGTASHSDFHAPAWNYGTVWTQAHTRLLNAPDNNISESGWYVLMTNLHETAWHDYMGGPISGWQHRYSSHIKNAAVYAEAARWAGGLYSVPVNAFFSDLDIDGVDELVIHNERVFAVIESVGGRAQWIFARGPSGYNYSVVGSCNTYWAETDGDYDEANSNNHQAALADVSPHYRNDLYAMAVDTVADSTASVHMEYGGIRKTVRVLSGQPYLGVSYDVGLQTAYHRHGFTPDLVDLVWNADMARVWAPDVSYMGFRNPHTGATGACVLANGGAAHQLEFGGTLLRGDEIRGYDRYGFLLFAGATSAPDSLGRVAELEALKTMNLDRFGPRMQPNAAFVNPTTVELTFSEVVGLASAQNPANWSLQGFAGGYTVTAAVRQSDWTRVRLSVSPPLAAGDSGLVVASGVEDNNGNPVLPGSNTAMLRVPSGFTPHTIVIDGNRDFDLASECLFTSVDTLTLTWDAQALFVGYFPSNLGAADLNINIDVNQQSGSGAATGSYGRERFADPFRIEYQVAIEGGVGGIDLNRWTGTSWQIRGYGQHTATSYNGWTSVPYTEVRIPWAELGNPAGIALSVNVLSETGNNTLRAFPPANPTDNLALLSHTYRIYPPYIGGNLPLFGVQPKFILSGDFIAPTNLVIQKTTSGIRLTWSQVAGAVSYAIYRSSSSTGPFELRAETTDTQFEDTGPLSPSGYYFQVQARSGI